MFKVRDKGVSKMYFRCMLRCAIVLLYSPSLYLERHMQYLKFDLVFDLNFFQCLFYPTNFMPLSTSRK